MSHTDIFLNQHGVSFPLPTSGNVADADVLDLLNDAGAIEQPEFPELFRFADGSSLRLHVVADDETSHIVLRPLIMAESFVTYVKGTEVPGIVKELKAMGAECYVEGERSDFWRFPDGSAVVLNLRSNTVPRLAVWA